MSTLASLVGPLVHLRTLKPFRSLSPAQVGLLALEAEEVAFPAEGWLIPAGEPTRALYMILDGYVRTVGWLDDRTFEPFSLVGYPDLLVPDAGARGVRAETEVVALRLETDALRDLCERNFPILAALLTQMADEVATNPDALRRALEGAENAGPLPFDGALGRVGRMVALQRSPVLPRESMDAIADLAGRVERIDLEAGERLWSPTGVAEGFFVVCTGAVSLGGDHGSGPDRRSGDALVVGPGGAPGFVETLSGRAYGAEATAVEDTTLLRVGIDPFMDVVEDHFELGYAILGEMAQWVLEGQTPGEPEPPR